MTRVILRLPVFASVVLAGTVLLAQTPGTPGQAPPGVPPKTDALGQKPTFRVTVDLVTNDVIARDSRGQFVADLTKEDFDLLEDGVPQQIASLVLVHGGRVSNLALPPPAAPPEGIILPEVRPTNDTSGRIFILFIDDLHLDFKNTARVRDLLKKIKGTLIHQGDMFGIVSSGTSSIAIDLTYDLKRIDEALKKVMGGALKPTDIIQGPEGQEGPTEVRYRAHVAFASAADLLDNLSKVHNRRKALIYVSNGYDFNPFEKSRTGQAEFFENRFGTQANPGAGSSSGDGTETNTGAGTDINDPSRSGAKFADADLVRELAELTRAANRANATIYTIDPRGLVGMPDLDDNVDPVEFQEYLSNSINSLRVLAEQTGGIAVVNQNDFDKALKRIDAETSDYYMIGYYSTNPDPLKRTRQIDVKVKRKDVDVWARKSYSIKTGPRR
ncbi:MAG: VWA domain-containing protein [Vicinamibacterales bacterium]|jgi:VWFA-related protein|nr:VWA domain-containing protein [Vicinamibacterales bacterium]